MCGIAAIAGPGCTAQRLEAMVRAQRHRGPDNDGTTIDVGASVGLGHSRLKIIDLSDRAAQPMTDPASGAVLAFNGELYNYRELKSGLRDYSFRSDSDTEVLLALLSRRGLSALDECLGMFAFLWWDPAEATLHAVRDRFGVKPLYYHEAADGTLFLASEIKAFGAAGIELTPDPERWARYLVHGRCEEPASTFWKGIHQVPAGHRLAWRDGRIQLQRWYDLAAGVAAVGEPASQDVVEQTYLELLEASVKLRFRADVPVGLNVSGGVDSSLLLGLVARTQEERSRVRVFTFMTGDERYDETPWVERMLAASPHPWSRCRLDVEAVPELAATVQAAQDEPFGGLPTLAYARLFQEAREQGVLVLLDGQGLDEQWAGYDYYQKAGVGGATVQGSRDRPLRPDCLDPEFARLAGEPPERPRPFGDDVADLQYWDTCYNKLPRALRYNDRVSMMSSVELREPFLDHRLFELALAQPRERKIQDGTGKWLLRKIAGQVVPRAIPEAPKRALQTPQREWLRGPLAGWVDAQLESARGGFSAAWLDWDRIGRAWETFRSGEGDNSFFVWQWVSLGLLSGAAGRSSSAEESA